MRWRFVWMALAAVAAIPAVAEAQPSGMPTLRVSVAPLTGSAHTRFAISFRAAATTGPTAAGRHAYSITARGPNSGDCQWSATVEAPPSRAGTHVRVVLAPRRSSSWCTGTFHGTVWDVVTLNCGNACPASLPPSSIVGKFTFRVTSG